MIKYIGKSTQTFNRIGNKKINLTVNPGDILNSVENADIDLFLATQLFEKMENLKIKKGDK